MSAEAWLQASSQVIAAIAALFGAIYGAQLGAKIAADATREAMEKSIAAEVAQRTQSHLDERRSALRGALMEIEANLSIFHDGLLSHLFIPLQNDALKIARPFVPELPPELRESLQRVQNEIAVYNNLAHYFNLRAANAGGDIRRFNDEIIKKRFALLEEAMNHAQAQLQTNLSGLLPPPNRLRAR